MGSVVGWLQGGGCIEFYVNYIALTGINLFLVRCTATGLKYVKNRAQQHFPNFSLHQSSARQAFPVRFHINKNC
jgi:hypothetical protein